MKLIKALVQKFGFAIFVAVLCFLLMNCFSLCVTAGSSMEPTYYQGTVLLCQNNFGAEPVKGAVYTIAYGETKLVKRVYAVAGETVTIDGVVYNYWVKDFPDCAGKIPEGYVFVCGDNAANSLDSRSPEIGLISVERLSSKVLCVLLRGKPAEVGR